ncbi:hypothetical protein AALO_G00240260 [Alosa alosa]|nr:hypothetical protein AALO_G00240260 [Alosa alosa]
MIQERQEKISEIKQSVELSRVSVEAEAASISELFSVLVLVLERSRGNLQGALEARQHAVETQANALTAQLEQEIHTLQSRHTQLEELTHTHDHLHLLQV